MELDSSALHMPILTLDEAKATLPRQPCVLPEKVEASTSTLWLILDRECSAPTLEESSKAEEANRAQMTETYRTYLRGNCPSSGLGRLLGGHGGCSESHKS